MYSVTLLQQHHPQHQLKRLIHLQQLHQIGVHILPLSLLMQRFRRKVSVNHQSLQMRNRNQYSSYMFQMYLHDLSEEQSQDVCFQVLLHIQLLLEPCNEEVFR